MPRLVESGKNNRAARAARIEVYFFDIVCQITACAIFKFDVSTTTRARCRQSFILRFYMKINCANEVKGYSEIIAKR